MIQAFKTRYFARWARKAGLLDLALQQAVQEMRAGLIDADLGGGIVKKRVALAGRGKRGGSRTLVATNHQNRWIFLFGFKKSDRENIEDHELDALKDYGSELLRLSAEQLQQYLGAGALEEISDAND